MEDSCHCHVQLPATLQLIDLWKGHPWRMSFYEILVQKRMKHISSSQKLEYKEEMDRNCIHNTSAEF